MWKDRVRLIKHKGKLTYVPVKTISYPIHLTFVGLYYDSHILPHVLRVMWPQNCTVTPQIDFSRGSPDPWNMRFMDITVPSQHTVDGKRFAAEIILSHTYCT
jgi:hypothetical protein